MESHGIVIISLLFTHLYIYLIRNLFKKLYLKTGFKNLKKGKKIIKKRAI